MEKTLVKNGLVERFRGGRCHTFHLTEKGRKLATRIVEVKTSANICCVLTYCTTVATWLSFATRYTVCSRRWRAKFWGVFQPNRPVGILFFCLARSFNPHFSPPSHGISLNSKRCAWAKIKLLMQRCVSFSFHPLPPASSLDDGKKSKIWRTQQWGRIWFSGKMLTGWWYDKLRPKGSNHYYCSGWWGP